MIEPDFISILRCPINPANPVVEVENGLQCTSCKTIFPINNGIPCFLTDEAILPNNARTVNDLPCRKLKNKTPWFSFFLHQPKLHFRYVSRFGYFIPLLLFIYTVNVLVRMG